MTFKKRKEKNQIFQKPNAMLSKSYYLSKIALSLILVEGNYENSQDLKIA